MIELQYSAKTLFALDSSFALGHLHYRKEQSVLDPLVIPFLVIVIFEISDRIPQSSFREENDL